MAFENGMNRNIPRLHGAIHLLLSRRTHREPGVEFNNYCDNTRVLEAQVCDTGALVFLTTLFGRATVQRSAGSR